MTKVTCCTLYELWSIAKGLVEPAFLIHKLFQGNKLFIDKKNYTTLDTANNDMMLDHRTMTEDGWIARVEFIHEMVNRKTDVLKEELFLKK